MVVDVSAHVVESLGDSVVLCPPSNVISIVESIKLVSNSSVQSVDLSLVRASCSGEIVPLAVDVVVLNPLSKIVSKAINIVANSCFVSFVHMERWKDCSLRGMVSVCGVIGRVGDVVYDVV